MPIGLLAIYDSTKSSYNALEYNYRQLMDGGSTKELMLAVQGEWKDDVWKIRQEFMRQVPYLSRDILMEVARKNVLPQALFLEICLANPDATKDYGFLKFLQYEIPNPLPAYMIALIESSWSQKTLRTDMESALSAMGSEKDYWLNLLLSNALQDSIQNRANIRSLYRDRASYSDYFSMAESYIEENDFDKAFETIYDLTESLPKITAEQEMEISDFKDYIAYRRKLHENSQSIHGLDSANLEWLITFENTHTGRGRVLAHNILCGLYDICLEELPEKSQAVSYGGAHGGATSASSPSAGKVQVFPNPAKEYASFIWDFGSFDGTAQLSITDQSGRPLLTRALPGAQGQWIWETGSVPSGSYVYSVTANGLQIETGKIVVTK
jgi:hypothetical protein